MSSPYADEGYLLARLRARELAAFDYLYQHYKYWLFLKVYSIVDDEAAAQDLVQEFFVDFWQHQLYDNISVSLKGYLLKILRNRALNYIRDTDRRTKRAQLYITPEELIMPDNATDEADLKYRLDSAIAQLPPQAGRVFTCHYIDKLSHKEIAELLGISRHTVSNHIDKALKILRKELKIS